MTLTNYDNSLTRSCGSILIKENYKKSLKNIFIINKNYRTKQLYEYTYRYKAILGFDFSYEDTSLLDPERRESVNGLSFFSSFGDASWLYLARANTGLDIGGIALRALKNNAVVMSSEGFSFHRHPALYAIKIVHPSNQQYNFAYHYRDELLLSMINGGGRFYSPFNETYHYSTMETNAPLFAPTKFGKFVVCNRNEELADFFKDRNCFIKLDFFNTKAAENFSKQFFCPNIMSYNTRSLARLLPAHYRVRTRYNMSRAAIVYTSGSDSRLITRKRARLINRYSKLFSPLRVSPLSNVKKQTSVENIMRRPDFFQAAYLSKTCSSVSRLVLPWRKAAKVRKIVSLISHGVKNFPMMKRRAKLAPHLKVRARRIFRFDVDSARPARRTFSLLCYPVIRNFALSRTRRIYSKIAWYKSGKGYFELSPKYFLRAFRMPRQRSYLFLL